jgi:murein DD-endopeptidase MepM/ murein hydrolase activator NlpD
MATSLFTKKRIILFICIILLIYPVSPVLFKTYIVLKEPDFIPPLGGEKRLEVRSDCWGDGHFNASRSGGWRRHKGLDLAGEIGKPVYASKSGMAYTEVVPYGMGKYVKIKHLDGYITIYGHLDSIDINNGRWVWQGQKIGTIGKTGNARYKNIMPHLHFEIREGKESIDPLPRLENGL